MYHQQYLSKNEREDAFTAASQSTTTHPLAASSVNKESQREPWIFQGRWYN